jgi:dTDP-4-dehydrorhamnose 3,5-epimerase
MQVHPTHISGLVVVEPRVFGDDRGYFFESFNAEKFREAGLQTQFLQDNQSLSSRGVLRGLHFQRPPHAQGKLVRVIKGAVLDVAVDIRKGSPTYGQHHKLELNEENKLQFYIPPGFAHGFATLANDTVFCYKCTDLYHPETEGSIAWNDPDLGIDWQLENPVLSDKDQQSPDFASFESPFTYS